MKITVNGNKHELGKALDRRSYKLGREKVAELAGIDPTKVESITFKHKNGESGELVSGQKTIAFENSSFTAIGPKPADAAPQNQDDK
ncbi:hypothetical protein SAMN06296273_1168 [Nitrosomonas ureae]|uniref:Uncharacterized protein n=1 Tax=Nitrosomonas ureae TaxID=44577 RepID=A0A285BWW1_9PROT|nr:hypothetical protein [Nitrosomonas ureae]SNX59732.1 hypothetical protein SAMN06296273_1168 [Nitrosomonas ureae]